jgi:hypothetical protein
MTHLSDEQLALHYYDASDVEIANHLQACEECGARMQRLNSVLKAVEIPVPERDENYGATVWHNLKGHLPEREARKPWWQLVQVQRWMAAGVVAALMLVAFFVGRVSQHKTPPPQVAVAPAPTAQPTENPAVPEPKSVSSNPAIRSTNVTTPVRRSGGRDRILMVAVGDHLERSQMVLVELINAQADGSLDISSQKKLAEDLVDENRLYRQAAQRDKDTSVANLLDELGRVLVDIAHEPSKLSGPELATIKQRIEAQGIVFKVRVVGSKIRQQRKQQQPILGKSS